MIYYAINCHCLLPERMASQATVRNHLYYNKLFECSKSNAFSRNHWNYHELRDSNKKKLFVIIGEQFSDRSNRRGAPDIFSRAEVRMGCPRTKFKLSPTSANTIADTFIIRSDAQNYMVLGDLTARPDSCYKR